MRRTLSALTKDLSPIMTQRFITNKNLPTCKTCEFYYISKKSKLPGYCTKFGEKNIITGDITYQFASVSRINTNMCGNNGIYYVRKNIYNNENHDQLIHNSSLNDLIVHHYSK
jgi:hypothetical protein